MAIGGSGGAYRGMLLCVLLCLGCSVACQRLCGEQRQLELFLDVMWLEQCNTCNAMQCNAMQNQ